MQKRIFAISFVLLIGVLTRYLFLTWGKPFFFHPDENNITTAITNMSWKQLNPHFFAYGSLPIYIAFFIDQILGWGKPSFALIAYTLRFLSATFSFLLVPSLFYIGKKVFNRRVGIISALLAASGTGLIQYAHFGTFEMWLTLFTLWFFYFCFLLWKQTTYKHLLLISFFAGILLGIKISSIVLLPIPPLILLLRSNKKTLTSIIFLTAYFSLTGIIYIITNPFILLNPLDVLGALHYESAVALGTLPVFYTQSFRHTMPIIFQLEYVFPFLLNPFIFASSAMGFLFLIKQIIKKSTLENFLLILFPTVIFLSQAFFFVKWNRYMVPIIPFLYLTSAFAVSKTPRRIMPAIASALFCISLFYVFIFMTTTYQADSRITAASFAKRYASLQNIITEPYDLGILPFYQPFPHLTVINLYDLDSVQSEYDNLQLALQNNSIFISLSQRLLRIRLKNNIDFPKGNSFYRLLSDEKKYRIVYQTPCDMLCKILYNGNPFYNVEETATVFDHPFITIFQKI